MRIEIFKLSRKGLLFFGILSLGGCLMVPHPFEKEGMKGMPRLASPPPARLAIPNPTQALLSKKSAHLLAEDMAKALVAQTVPAVAESVQKGDWYLIIKAKVKNNTVTPSYSIFSPDGKNQASREGMPLPAKAWFDGNNTFLTQMAQQAAPIVSDILSGIQARLMEQDPKSLKHRPAKIYFKGVKGATGDGDMSIARQFAISFPDASNAIQTTPKGADFTVSCKVKVTNGPAGTTGHPVQHVEIVWTVINKKGEEAGKVSQINDVPAHSLDVYWADVASAVGEEAAGGVKQVITNNSGRNIKPLPEGGGKPEGSPLLAPPNI